MGEPETVEEPRSLLRRVLKWAALAFAVVVAVPLVSSVLMRVLDPPLTAYMVTRMFEGERRQMEWRDLDRISGHLVRGVVANEDARFCAHDGIDWVELDKVLDRVREDRDAAARGASTITMQTVKNLFLWPHRSYVRKGLELPLALWLDFVLPKRRILEIYLNIVEWAPGVYGAQAASQHHFGRDADKLTREQAALLAAVLPNPIARSASGPGRTTRRVADRVLRRMRTIDPYIGCLGLD